MSQPDPEQQRKKREQRAEQLRDEMPIELRVEKFNELLAEHNISAFSTFERESPKLEKDERFLLVRVKCIFENGLFGPTGFGPWILEFRNGLKRNFRYSIQ